MLSCSAVWAKVAASGYSNGAWASDALIAANGIYKFTIPSTLKPGQYLVRHEIIGEYGISGNAPKSSYLNQVNL